MLDIRTASGRRNRLLALAVVTVAFCALAAGLSHYAAHPFNGMDAQGLDSDLQSSLPIGSSMDAGRTWFATYGIEPLETVLEDKETGCVSHLIYARVPNNTLLETAEIDIWLRYDTERRLKSAKVQRFVESP